jgi:hypothetical protein
MELLKRDYAVLDKKFRESEDERQHMRMVVDEFERTMGKMISASPIDFWLIVDDARAEKDRHRIMVERATDDRGRLQSELNTVEMSFKELRVRYEDLKSVTEQYRKVHPILDVC